jgi:hypothetical protein
VGFVGAKGISQQESISAENIVLADKKPVLTLYQGQLAFAALGLRERITAPSTLKSEASFSSCKRRDAPLRCFHVVVKASYQSGAVYPLSGLGAKRVVCSLWSFYSAHPESFPGGTSFSEQPEQVGEN